MFDLEGNQSPEVNHLEELVGEGKKFKDVDSLAKGKAEADRLIEEQKTQLAALQNELQQRGDLKSFLEELKTKTPAPVPAGDPQVVEPVNVSEVVRLELERIRSVESTKTNMQIVNEALKAQFGKDALTVVEQKAISLGMTKEALEGLAKQSPQAALSLLGVQAQPVTRTAVPVSNVVPGQHSEVRDRKFYDRMRQNSPKQYNDPKIVSQMIRDRTQLGASFYN